MGSSCRRGPEFLHQRAPSSCEPVDTRRESVHVALELLVLKLAAPHECLSRHFLEGFRSIANENTPHHIKLVFRGVLMERRAHAEPNTPSSLSTASAD